MNKRVIAVDFDATCVSFAYPHIGKDIGAVPVLRELVQHNHLVLWTMRDGKELQAAVDWFSDNDIPLYGVQRNPTQHWTTSPKCHADLFIDDAALGAPLTDSYNGTTFARPVFDWSAARQMLTNAGYL